MKKTSMKVFAALTISLSASVAAPGFANAYFQSAVMSVKEGDKLQNDYFEVWEITCEMPTKASGRCQIVAVAFVTDKEVTRVNTYVHTGRIRKWYDHNFKAEFDGRGGLSLILSMTEDDRKATRIIGSLKNGNSFELDTESESKKVRPIRNESFAVR